MAGSSFLHSWRGDLFCSRLIFCETGPVVLQRTVRPYNGDLPLPHDFESALQKLQFCLLKIFWDWTSHIINREQILRGKQSHRGTNVINRYLFAMKYNLTTYFHGIWKKPKESGWKSIPKVNPSKIGIGSCHGLFLCVKCVFQICIFVFAPLTHGNMISDILEQSFATKCDQMKHKSVGKCSL